MQKLVTLREQTLAKRCHIDFSHDRSVSPPRQDLSDNDVRQASSQGIWR